MNPRESQLARALADYHDAVARGEAVDIDLFCRNYPDIERQLRGELETVAGISSLLGGEPPPAEKAIDKQPDRLSGCRVLGAIGSGGMGKVFLALDERLDRKVAIKILKPPLEGHPALRSRFLHEARAMARLSHPNIARIYSLGPEGEPPHFVMEFVEGVPLTDAAAPLALRQKIELMHKVTLAVDFLHRHGVIHRDLKPGNILVGPDLEPKVLDFGLALEVDGEALRLTLGGEIMGTPAYFSPEQTRGAAALDARSDVFSLGTILYEILTGTLPFHAPGLAEQLRATREHDPVLPRRLNPAVPGELQNVCLKALEKDPADRYGSARELAADLERYLAGEAVLAAPASYSRLMAGKISQHLRELKGWFDDHLISELEYDAFQRSYSRLTEPEDAWILQARRLSIAQVSLYLGAWVITVGAGVILLSRYAGLQGTPAVLAVSAAAALAAWLGIDRWKRGEFRIGVAHLMAFCLLLPIAMLVAMHTWRVLSQTANESREFFLQFSSFQPVTNAQMWWALILSLPACYWLRRFTRSSVFSLVVAAMCATLTAVTLLRMGMLEWLEKDPGKVYFHLIPYAAAFLAAGIVIERLDYSADSRYFYPIAVAFTLIAFSGVAAYHEPYAAWLGKAAPWTRAQHEYLFIANAGLYLALQYLCGRFPSPQMRVVAKAFRFVVPGHVLTSLFLLGIEASSQWAKAPARADLRLEARIFEVLLPLLACVFVFGSIPKQMKNYLVTGLVFLAIGAVRLQQDLFKDLAAWPVSLLVTGTLLMLAAANYSRLKVYAARWLRRSK